MFQALVIDDEAPMADIIGRFLTSAGYRVETATSGPEGLRKAVLTPPDVVVVDVMMPGMDGYEVCRRLRGDPRTARAVIVVLTARGQLIDKELALRAGADAHITKPFKGKALAQEIHRLLAGEARTAPPLGYQVLVLRLKEGAGATTVATNLALCLVQETQKLTAVADMALQGGQVEHHLGLPPTSPWLETVRGRADALAGRLLRHESGLFALPAPPLTPGGAQPDPTVVEWVLRTLREWHDYVVVDTPFHLGSMAPVLLKSSPLVLLLLTPDAAALRSAQASLAALQRPGSPVLQVRPVLNMADPDDMSFRRRMEAALGLPVIAALPWSPKECAWAVANHKPVALSHPRSPLAGGFRTLAHRVAQIVSQPSLPGRAR